MLTEQQRAELERRGWGFDHDEHGWPWFVKDSEEFFCEFWPTRGVVYGDVAGALEVAAILGIAPPGYRLMPERDAALIAEVLGQLSYREVVTHGGFSEEQYRCVKALASALQGEVEKR